MKVRDLKKYIDELKEELDEVKKALYACKLPEDSIEVSVWKARIQEIEHTIRQHS